MSMEVKEDDKTPVGLCPKCGTEVERTPFGWACAAGKEACGFVVWGEVAKKKLPAQAVRELVQDLATSKEIHGFKSKTGKEFSAKLYLDPEEGYRVRFKFDDAPKEVLGKCPGCGGDVVETPKAFGCRNWKDADHEHVTIWKEIAGHRVSLAEAKKLLAGEEIGRFGFTSRNTGKEFRASLKLESCEVEMVFPDQTDEEDY